MKNILHLSDLHFSTSPKFGLNTNQSPRLLDALIADIKAQSIDIDTIFITGDISFSGNEEEFTSINENFITPLLNELKLTLNDLYIVPGNHDMNRSQISVTEKLTRNLASEDIKLIYNSINNSKDEWKRLDNYNAFAATIKNSQNNIIYDSPLITVRDLGKKLRVHCINSAWLAGDDNDHGSLRILNLLTDTLRKQGKTKKNILLMHHPISWIHKDENNEIAKLIEKNIDAVFYGHMHEFEQSVTINFNQDITLKLQAGTIDTRNENAGYSLISLNSHNSFQYGRVIYRKFSIEDNSYQPWVERIESGCSDFSLDKSLIFDSSKFSEQSIELVNKIEYSHLINTGRDGQGKFKLSEIFIPPKLNSDHTLKNIFPDIGNIDNLEKLEDMEGCILISGTEQQGRTTLLKQIQLSYLKKQSQYNFQNIVFYIDLKNEYRNHHNILKELISNYESDNLKTSFDSRLKSCISDGNAIFLIDNYDKCTSICFDSINKFITEHTNNNFIITGDIENNIDNLTKINKCYSGDIYNSIISDIARCDIRQIISRRPIKTLLHSEDELFNNLIKVVDNSQLPHNHFVYSILLIIYEEKNHLVGILNEADIIENYIEILLQKHCMSNKSNTPEYKVLLHLLGYICSNLIFNKASFLSEKELTTYILEFEKLTYNNFPLNSYIDPITNSGILTKIANDNYEFSNICFLYYFSAYYMNTNEKLKEFIFEGDNYIHLEKVVEYYASINSSNFNVLNFFEDKVKTARSILNTEINNSQGMDIESLNIDDVQSISLLDVASSSDEFERSINDFKIDQNKFDQDLDNNIPLRGKKEKSHSIDRINAPSNNINSGLSYRKELSILSKVFRNTELVMDPDEVMRIFNLIIDSYVYLIKSDIASLNENIVLPLLLPKFEKAITNNDIKLEEKDEVLQNLKQILAIIKACIPNVVEQLLSSNLSTKKPRFINILNANLEQGNSNEIEELLIRFLLLDIERGNFKTHINELYNLKGKVASNALFLKLIHLSYTRHDFKADEQKFLQNKMADLVKNNRSLNKESLEKLTQMTIA